MPLLRNLATPVSRCYGMSFCRYYTVQFFTTFIVHLFDNYVFPRMSSSTIQAQAIELMRSVHLLPGIRSAVFTARSHTRGCDWVYMMKGFCPECKEAAIGAPFPECLAVPLCCRHVVHRIRFDVIALLHSYATT